ncbi:hypothetical protein [Candidatus Mycoplasma haematohominis]|uniref:Uncharacterized protein n=1 Tax=Candidatus Mycoplasma haematohominis TaxID=1494318 RepID=A0A478FUU9_9MOLU|nr:hypothetical protein [Candidatus Mycoplasma haemohominis]GCE63895.1 hypothetical protein MHSWG343_09020 [Candidatus Mycoplasma haemohominis]
MSTQAVGAAAAGTVVIGGGGTLAAYAAGAFDKDNYLTQAKKDSDIKNKKEYIGKNKDEISKLLSSGTTDTTYQTALDGAWDNMDSSGLPSITKPEKTSVKDNTKASEVANYTNAWCEHISKKTLEKPPIDADADKNTWDAFKAACFNTKKFTPVAGG